MASDSSESTCGVYGSPRRDLVGYGAETPDPLWPSGVSSPSKDNTGLSWIMDADMK